MTIQEIKAQIGVQTVPFQESKKTDGTVSEFVTNWDNDVRRQISILATDLKLVMDNTARTDLYVHHTKPVSTTSGLAYDNYRIGIIANVVGTL